MRTINTIIDVFIFFGFLAFCMLFFGCATKTRSIELDGMYLSESGTVAIGSVDIMAAPKGEESATIKYEEDTAWLSPSTKTHEIKIMITGTNSISKVDAIVKSICNAFVNTKIASEANANIE